MDKTYQLSFTIIYFLRDIWLWSMTWGWYQISLGLLFTWLFLMSISRMKSLPALILTVSSYWSAFVVYTFFVVFILMNVIHAHHIPTNVVNNGTIAISLALLFTLLQIMFLTIINRWYRMNLRRVIIATLLGNVLAALCATYFMRFSLITV